MKPIAQYNNVEKARLLFQLFPSEISGFLAFQKAVTENLVRDPDQLKEQWENRFITIDFWIGLASEIQTALHKYGIRLAKSSRLFADQLFDGHRALYSVHCIHQYIRHQQPEDSRFQSAVELLFRQ